jgi:hypothetical protein
VSVTFYTAKRGTDRVHDGRVYTSIEFMIEGRCGCRELEAEQDAWVNSPAGTPYPQCPVCRERDQWSMNLSNSNAADLCEWLGAPFEEYSGELPATELAALCRRRLWPEPRNQGVEVPARVESVPGRATIVTCAREADYLPRRTRQLLDLCERSIQRFGAGVLMAWA